MIDYYWIFYCLFHQAEDESQESQHEQHHHHFSSLTSYVIVGLMVLWSLWLIHFLSQAAANYFSPTLATISRKLQMNHDLAGVTLLALGNGAPDVFSIIASFKKSAEDPSVGIGAIIGASLFASALIIGSIAIVCPCEINAVVYIRDCFFHLLAAIAIGWFHVVGEVTLSMAALLFVVYLIYIVIVMSSARLGCHNVEDVDYAHSHNHPEMHDHHSHAEEGRHSLSDKGHSHDHHRQVNYSHSHELHRHDGNHLSHSLDFEHDHHHHHQSAASTYSYDHELVLQLISSSHEEVEEDEQRALVLRTSSDQYGTFQQQQQKQQHTHDHDHYHHHMNLKSESEEAINALNNNPTILGHIQYYFAKLLISLDWRTFALQRRFHHQLIINEWKTFSTFYQYYYQCIEFPITLLHDLSIPSLEEGSWNQIYAILHPILDLLLLVYISTKFEGDEKWLGMSPLVFCFVIGGCMSLFIALTTKRSEAPSSFIFQCIWTIMAFVMCIVWISFFADELVVCLTALGNILEIPSGLLGITILAWGNGIGDYCTNLAIAKQGYGAMAIAGSNAGPIFNILIGFGISLFYSTSIQYPEPYYFHIHESLLLSIYSLIGILGLSFIIVLCRKFQFDSIFGMMLIGYYIIYSFIQLIFVLLGGKM